MGNEKIILVLSTVKVTVLMSRVAITIYLYTSSTAQGGGGSFKTGNLSKRFVVVSHDRWQSEDTDGPTGG